MTNVIRSSSRSLAAVLESAVTRGGQSVSVHEGASLLSARGAELRAVAAAADELRSLRCGHVVSYAVNRNINFTNACAIKCGFCAFSRTGIDAEAYLLPVSEIVRRVHEAVHSFGATEVCVQAGLPPGMKGSLYPEIAAAIKEAVPSVHLHAFSPEEVRYGAKRSGCSVREYLSQLKDAGVDSLPGTSAEILDDAVRRRIAGGRLSSEQWCEVVTAAHELGLRTTSTIMYGHVETVQHRAAHIGLIRDIQAKTGGFTEFVPLSFVAAEAPMWREEQRRKHQQQQQQQQHQDDAALNSSGSSTSSTSGSSGSSSSSSSGSSSNSSSSSNEGLLPMRAGPTGSEVVAMHAVARIMLDNGEDASKGIHNIQASWVKEGVRLAQLLLDSGCNDCGGTLMNESISTTAGAKHGQLATPADLRALIRDCNRTPRQRTTLYQTIKTFDKRGTAESDVEPVPAAAALEGVAARSDSVFGSYAALAGSSDNRFRATLPSAKRRQQQQQQQQHQSSAATGGCGQARGFSSTSTNHSSSSNSSSKISNSGSSSSSSGIRLQALEEPVVTYSASYTVIPTYECFNRCSYCTFRADPRRGAASWLTVDAATAQLQAAVKRGTVREVLVMSGEVAPTSDLRGPWLQRVAALCEAALSLGLHPHTNVGPLSVPEMRLLQRCNTSMGLMLEQVSPALAAKGGVHRYAPSKRSATARLQQLRQAGELKVPFTTGVLLGIGEGEGGTEDSIRAIAEIARQYGHIQECIIQPYSAAAGTRAGPESFPLQDLPAVVAMARHLLPDSVVVQVPPNLVHTPAVLLECLQAGARDLGGISPKDEVNAEYAFPEVPALQSLLADNGYRLVERLAVHHRLVHWLPDRLQTALKAAQSKIEQQPPLQRQLQQCIQQ